MADAKSKKGYNKGWENLKPAKKGVQEPKRQTEDPRRRQSNAESGDSCGSQAAGGYP